MKNILLILLLTTSYVLAIDSDKAKHFLVSATIAGSITAIARHNDSNEVEAFLIGFGSTVLLGYIKERIDKRTNGTPERNDTYANILGAGTGALIATQWEWKF